MLWVETGYSSFKLFNVTKIYTSRTGEGRSYVVIKVHQCGFSSILSNSFRSNQVQHHPYRVEPLCRKRSLVGTETLTGRCWIILTQETRDRGNHLCFIIYCSVDQLNVHNTDKTESLLWAVSEAASTWQNKPQKKPAGLIIYKTNPQETSTPPPALTTSEGDSPGRIYQSASYTESGWR